MSYYHIANFISDLRAANSVVIDTETTGLQVCRGKHVPFLFTARVGDKSYCIDFRDFLEQLEFVSEFNEILQSVTDLMIVGHNLKFDMHALENIGVVWPDYDQGITYYCTASGARILNNLEDSLSLAALSKKYCGIEKKDDSVTKWFSENKKIGITPANKSESGKSEKHFDRIPNEILIPYAIQDVIATQALFEYQTKELQTLQSHDLDLFPLLLTEMKVTYATYKMEQQGLLIDKDFINSAILKEKKLIEENKRQFELVTGRKYIDSAKNFAPIFKEYGFGLPTTDKGNPKIDEATLLKYEKECELIKYILAVRNSEKRLGTYLENFLLLCGKDGCIHPSFNQAGTASGRFSSSNPNAQNLSKGAEDTVTEEYPIRGCFVAPEGYKMLAVDADQQEYRLLADLAGEHTLIDKINSGLDVHTATAEMLGVTRSAAKCVHPSTFLYDGDKYVRIGSLCDDWLLNYDSFFDIDQQVATPEGYSKAYQFYSSGVDKTRCIIARHGIILCSHSHKIKMLDGSLKAACDIVVDDVVSEAVYFKYEGNYQRVRINPFLKEAITTKNKGSYYAEINEDLAYVLGMFMGDGCANKNHLLIATGGDLRYVNWQAKVKESIEKIGINASINKNFVNSEGGVSGSVYFGSTHTARFFKDLSSIDNEGKKNFNVPDYLFSSPISVRLSFVAGLFDTDGTVCKKQGVLSFTTKSIMLAHDVCVLLGSCGIKFSVEPSWNKKYLRYYYRVRVQKSGNKDIGALMRREEKIKRIKLPSFSYKEMFPNKVKLVSDCGENSLVDISINNDSCMYYANGFSTHNTINFGLLYGMGVGSLANKLKVDITESQRLRSLYFQNLPEIGRISKELSFVAQDSGSIMNWAGRRLFIERDRSYTAVNYYIQGGCADIIKKAIVDCHERLRKLKSKMIATIHDEIVFLLAEGEEHLEQELPLIIERAYPPRNGLRLTASGKKGKRFSELK